jgi:hypothetical protein
MLESNWKTWLVLVAVFMGASFELLKHLPEPQPLSWQRENFHYNVEGKPYSMHDATPAPKLKVIPRPALHLAGDQNVLRDALSKYQAANSPQATEAQHKDAAKAAAEKKKKKNDDEYEEVFDPATGKMVKRKKKKKDGKDAKKEDKPATVASGDVTPTNMQPDEPDKTDANTIAAAIAQTAQSGEPPAPSPTHKSAAEPFASLAEWEHLLLNHPDLAETKVFIQDYKTHTVSSDIFYNITKQMIADSRADMKSLGVLCAGATQSVLSFQILSEVATTGSGDLKNQATQLLNVYGTTLSDLAILQSVLHGTNANSQMEALTQLNTSVQHFLAVGTASTGGQTGGANAASFKPFLDLLKQLSTTGQGTVASQAKQTLTTLENLLGQSPSSIAATTP